MSNNGLAPIKKWKVEHERVVHLHIMGWGNEEIGEEVGYTKVRVSQILQDPKAAEIINEVRTAMRKRLKAEIKEGLSHLAAKSVDRLKETMDQDFQPGSPPKHHQDKIGIDLLKGTGWLDQEREDSGADTRPPLDPELSERLVSALEFANKALAMQDSNNVEDAEYEIVDE